MIRWCAVDWLPLLGCEVEEAACSDVTFPASIGLKLERFANEAVELLFAAAVVVPVGEVEVVAEACFAHQAKKSWYPL